MLQWRDGSTFGGGKSRYLDEDPSHPSTTVRIHVQVQFDGVSVLALLDTGASWSLVSAELAGELGLFDREGEPATISSRAGIVKGKLRAARQ